MYLKTCLLILLSIGVVQAKGNVKILLINIIRQPSTINNYELEPT